MTPRTRFAPFLFLLLAAAAFAPLAWSDRPADAALRVDGVTITVGDLDRSVDFFSRVLDFAVVARDEVTGDAYEQLFGVFPARIRRAPLHLGDERVTLMQFLAPEGRPVPADARSTDLWFQHIAIVVRDMDAAYARLREHNVRHVSSGPQTLPDWNPNAGGIRAFYFKDPDGHVLEIIWFPEGKGDPRWQRPTDRLFLGIDHTAIGIDDTRASTAFYRDLLGLSVAGKSENYGGEQERLNAVFGARLEITGLRAQAGPGIEFLEYLAPGGGRPYPEGSTASDLWQWHTAIHAPNIDDAFTTLRANGVTLVSPRVITLRDPVIGAKAFVARDPDGHAVLVTGE